MINTESWIRFRDCQKCIEKYRRSIRMDAYDILDGDNKLLRRTHYCVICKHREMELVWNSDNGA